MSRSTTFWFVCCALTALAAGAAGCLGSPPELLSADAGFDATSAPETSAPPDDATVNDVESTDAGSSDAASDGPTDIDGTGPVCLDGGPCALTQCQIGASSCSAAGTSMCTTSGNLDNGTSCDAGADASAVCNGGVCGLCNSGADCTEAGSCQQMNVVCASGSPVCTHNGTVTDGKPCGANLFCDKGSCEACVAGSSCPVAGKPCNAGKASCSQGALICNDQMTSLANGTPCGTNEVCSSGQCVACTGGLTCTPTGQPCHTGKTSCSTGVSVCVDMGAGPNGTTCTGTNKCEQTYSCQTGVCTGSNPVTCTASDQCHTVGACNTSTGVCSNPAAANSTACSDGNGCTQSDTCQSGVCTAGAAVSCPAIDACHTVGTCTSTGATTHTCSTPVAASGKSCGTNMTCNGSGACGCAAGYTACGAACVNLASDTGNCGTCGRSCYYGACSSGSSPPCAQWTVASSINASELVSDGTYVIWYDNTAGAIVQKSVSGTGSTVTLLSDPSLMGGGGLYNFNLSLASGTVAFSAGTSVYTVKVNQPTTAAAALQPFTIPSAATINDVALNTALTHLTLTNSLSSGSEEFYDCTLGSTTCLDVGTFGGPAAPLSGNASNASRAFFVDMSTNSVRLYAFGTGAMNYLALNQSLAGYSAAVDANNAYWAVNGSPPAIVRAPILGGTVATVGTVAANTVGIDSIATDGKNVYISTNGTPPVVAYAPVTANAVAMTAIGGLSNPSAITTAGGMVFWIDGTNIFGIAAP